MMELPIALAFFSVFLSGCGSNATKLVLDDKLLENSKKWTEDKPQAAKFKLSEYAFDSKEAEAIFTRLAKKRPEKHYIIPSNCDSLPKQVYESGPSRMVYTPTGSEFLFMNSDVGPLPQDEQPIASMPDVNAQIQRRLDVIVKERGLDSVLVPRQVKAEPTFTNAEITSTVPEKGQAKIATEYTGRYGYKVEDRLIMGNSWQSRLGYGGNKDISFFELRRQGLEASGSAEVIPRRKVLDQFMALTREGVGKMYFPNTSDWFIDTLRVKYIFNSYVISHEKDEKDRAKRGDFLIPAVTAVAEAKVKVCKKKSGDFVPTEPLIIHYNFPCVSDMGQCWSIQNR